MEILTTNTCPYLLLIVGIKEEFLVLKHLRHSLLLSKELHILVQWSK